MRVTESAKNPEIKYPYMPAEGTIEYVLADNKYIREAKEYSRQHSLDKTMPTGAVLVKNGEVIGRGANGSDYHEKHGCERVRLGIPTGQGYELCEGCSPKNHSEPRAVADAAKHNQGTEGAEIYLWGHWWACESCWDALLKAGVTQMYLQDDSQVLFNKEAPGNIVGRQFA
ncbi:MAG TPA: deaminase [Candidatus Saccharimonadales bacterium]|nr:deaminase [Candidatus Saccharimonadales bacterium]